MDGYGARRVVHGWMDRWIDMGEGDAVSEKEGDREDREGGGEVCEEGEEEGEGERRARKEREKNGGKKAGKRGGRRGRRKRERKVGCGGVGEGFV